MPLWKITDKGPAKVQETKFKKEKLLEEDLENWIEQDASILGEPLFIFGRQVIIPDTKDKVDLLAIDPQGAITVIELKRGHLKDPVDMQSIRYASYFAKWTFQDFENVARNYFRKIGDPEFNFNELYENFCAETGVDDIPDINAEQRIIIAGSSVREKLGNVALWLREHKVDIKLIEVRAYKEGNYILIEPTTIVPVPVSRFVSVGKAGAEGHPWTTDGKTWHLEKRCSPKTKQMLLLLDQVVNDEFEIQGTKWNQKYYVAYPANNYNWMLVHTRPRFLILDFRVKAGVFKTEDLAKLLGVEKFDPDETLTGKLSMPSTVFVKNRTQVTDRIRLRAKEDFDFKSKVFLAFLKDTYKASLK